MPESYTGTEGTTAAANGMDILDGTEDRRQGWLAINKTRDYIVSKIAALWPLTIARGGTGATTAEDARENLELVKAASAAAPDNTIPYYHGGGHLAVSSPASGTHAANKEYVDTAVAGVGGSSAADTVTSAAYNRNATGSGFFAMWMNSALQIMRNTSSRRYKENIRDWTGSVLGLRTVIFDRIGEDAAVDEVGFIAEEVYETLPQGVVWWEGEIDGISDRSILAAAVATIQELHRELDLVAQRLAELEVPDAGN